MGIGQQSPVPSVQGKEEEEKEEEKKRIFWAKRNETFADLRRRYVITHTRDRLAIKIETGRIRRRREKEVLWCVCVCNDGEGEKKEVQ